MISPLECCFTRFCQLTVTNGDSRSLACCKSRLPNFCTELQIPNALGGSQELLICRLAWSTQSWFSCTNEPKYLSLMTTEVTLSSRLESLPDLLRMDQYDCGSTSWSTTHRAIKVTFSPGPSSTSNKTRTARDGACLRTRAFRMLLVLTSVPPCYYSSNSKGFWFWVSSPL